MRTWFASWFTRARCFHHDIASGTSWIVQQTLLTRRHRYRCSKCGRLFHG